MASRTLKRMMHLSIPTRFRHCRLVSLGMILRFLPWIFIAACTALSLPLLPFAREAKEYSAATLVEAANYQPCRNGCSEHAEPATAFCIRQGNQIVVGDGSSYLHEKKFTGLEELAGKRFKIRLTQRFVWFIRPEGRAIKLG